MFYWYWWNLWLSLFINFLFISINENNWFAESMFFCRGSLDGICVSCEVPSIADTTLGISEQYPFFCHQTGMVGHWILRLHTFYKSTHVEFKMYQQLKHWHQIINKSINQYCTVRVIYRSEFYDHRWATTIDEGGPCWAWAVWNWGS